MLLIRILRAPWRVLRVLVHVLVARMRPLWVRICSQISLKPNQYRRK